VLESALGAASGEAADVFVATESDMVTLVAFAFAKNAPERRASGHSTAHGHRMKKNRVFRRCNRQTTINARTSDPQGVETLRIFAGSGLTQPDGV
jgi:hypothetical protein